MSRIYVVDDHPGDLELYTHVLEHGGHEPVGFTDPLEALRAIAADPPHVVLVDVLMPGLDGFELVHALRADEATRDQCVVLASGVYTKGEFARLPNEIARCTFLPKPATPEALLAAVEHALSAESVTVAATRAEFERAHKETVRLKILAATERSATSSAELARRVRQDAALAELGRIAIGGADRTVLLEALCTAVERELDADLVEILEIEDFGRMLRMTAGLGWYDGVVGRAVVDARPGTLAAEALHHDEVHLIAATAGVELPERLGRQGVNVGLRAPIPGPGGPVGVLGVYVVAPRCFSDGDRAFLQAAANLAGSAIEGSAAHAEAQAREVQLRAVFEGAADALVIVDRELRCVRANNAAAELLQRPVAELIGMTAVELVAPEARQALERSWGDALRDGTGTGLTTVLRQDGTRRIAEYRGTMEIIAGFHLVSLRDVTERVEMENALRETMKSVSAAEQRYSTLIETLPDGIVVVNARGEIALVNAQTERMFGYVRGELIGQRLELLLPERHRDAHVAHRERFAEASSSRAMGVGLDLAGRRKDGSEFAVEVSLGVVETSDGPMVTSIVTDVTERVRLERQLHQSQKLESIGILAGGVAHDFNNILQVILGYAAALRPALDESGAAADLGEIENAATHAALLTKQLLAFSKRQVVKPVVLDLNEVVDDLERMLSRIVGEDAALTVELDRTLSHILADRAQIEQVLANLVVNARDAIQSGGRISITTRAVTVDERVSELDLAPGHYARLCVSDTGCGMSEGTLARAFEPFFTTKAERHGTGLGLSTAYGIVTQGGGQMRIESSPGEGTTVCIHLPTTTERAVGAPRHVQHASPRGGNERLLLVEDEPVVRRLLESVLTGHGYDVTTAEDAGTALDKATAATTPFDLLITDFVLPDLTGGELASRLVARGAAAAVLYVSGYAPDARLGADVNGARTDFLSKPFTNDVFADRVRRILDGDAGRP